MVTKMKEFREHFATASQEPSRGGFGEDSGWIWGGFWDGFGRIWEARGGPNGHENRYMSKEIQVLPSGSPKGGFGDGSGRFWGGSGKDLGGFGRTLKGILANPRNPGDSSR